MSHSLPSKLRLNVADSKENPADKEPSAGGDSQVMETVWGTLPEVSFAQHGAPRERAIFSLEGPARQEVKYWCVAIEHQLFRHPAILSGKEKGCSGDNDGIDLKYGMRY